MDVRRYYVSKIVVIPTSKRSKRTGKRVVRVRSARQHLIERLAAYRSS